MLVWVPHDFGPELLGDLPAGIEVEVWNGKGGVDALPASKDRVEVLVPGFLANGRGAEVFAHLPNLKLIQLMSAGADAWVGNVPEGIVLADGQGMHTPPTAEWAVGAILASIREFPRFVRAHDEGRWDYGQTGELAGSTVLIVGHGDIGKAIEARLTPFDVSFLRVARTARPDEDVRSVDELPTLLPQADVVVVIVPLTPATHHLVDAKFLASMKDGALLVNAARGAVVDTDALVEALNSERIAAAIDVTDPEPLPEGHPLWKVPGLFMTPHVAGTVPGTWRRAYAGVADQLRRYAADPASIQNVVSQAGY